MTDPLIVRSPAKINLFLHILGQRADGYHDLQTLFQFIDLCDLLTFETPDGCDDIHLISPGLDLPPEDNLIVRAARALQRITGARLGAHITLEKTIPMGGGLGGGSSNAATTLVALNTLWGTGLDTHELERLGVSLGADVPVFIHGHAALAEGVGEVLTDVTLDEPWYLLAIPSCHVPTHRLFQEKQLTRNSPRITLEDFLAGQKRNDFEPVTRRLFPDVDCAMRLLGKVGQAQMTGTGACVFARFDSEEAAQNAATLMRDWLQAESSPTRVLVTRGMNRSPLYAGRLTQAN